jgi:hypothetical protein
LITRDKQPWLPVEVKMNDADPSPNWEKFIPYIGCKNGLQIVSRPYWKMHKIKNADILVAGAHEALQYLV